MQNLFLDGDTQMMVVGEFGNALKAKAFYNAFLAEPGLSQAFPKGSVEFFYLANSQLKTVMAQKSVEDFLKYFNAKNP